MKKKMPDGEVSPSATAARTMVAATPTAPSQASSPRAQAPREYRLIMKTATKEIEFASKSAAKWDTATLSTVTMMKIASGALLRSARATDAATPSGSVTAGSASG